MNITYVAACLDSSGYAEASRNHIAALDHAGVKVNVVPVSFEGYRSDLGQLGMLVQSLISRNTDGDIRIIHLTPQNYAGHIKPDKYNIGYCAWETDRLPNDWVPMINNLNEVWVPSEHNRVVFEESGITVPVQVMPHPFAIETEPEPVEANSVANVTENEFVFYSIFQWTERKNAIDLLKCYLTEFKASEDVALVLKTYVINPNNPQETVNIKRTIAEVKKKLYLPAYPKILLISSLLSRPQIRALHVEGDCYVSLHRCEGFGIPFAEAMLAGNPCISTGYGGQVDFMETQMLVDYDITPVYGMPWGLYTGEMKWAQPRLMDARQKMRSVFENREAGELMGQNGKEEIRQKLNYDVLGKRMKDRLEKIQEALK